MYKQYFCDSCGDNVKASWVAINIYQAEQQLFFCHHHKKEVEARLRSLNWELYDL